MPKWCTVSVPWSNDQVAAGFSIVVPDPRFHNRRGGVDLPPCHPPFPPKSSKPSFCAFDCLRERRGGTIALWAQCPSERPMRFSVPPRGASRLRMLGRWRRQYTWASCNRATRGYSRPPRPADGGGPSTTPRARQLQRVVETSNLGEHVLVRTRALWGNASVARCRASR